MVEGADFDVRTAMDRPEAEGDTQGLGQAPEVIAANVSQVAQDGELGVALAYVVVGECRRRRPDSTRAETHAVELDQGLV